MDETHPPRESTAAHYISPADVLKPKKRKPPKPMRRGRKIVIYKNKAAP